MNDSQHCMTSIQPFDDSPFLERLALFKTYLASVRETHAAMMQPYRLLASHKDDKPQRRVRQMTFVYLLSANSERQPATISTRHFAAPVWTAMNAA